MAQVFLNGFNLDELLEKIGQVIDSKLQVATQNTKENQSKFITRKEVAQLLKISLPTLSQWTKEGKLQSYKPGNRVLYKQDEVLLAVDKVATYKFKKGGFNHASR